MSVPSHADLTYQSSSYHDAQPPYFTTGAQQAGSFWEQSQSSGIQSNDKTNQIGARLDLGPHDDYATYAVDDPPGTSPDFVDTHTTNMWTAVPVGFK